MSYEFININNYKILLIPSSESKLVFCQSYILSGRMNENKKTSGISHLLEHVLTESWKKCKDDCAKYWGKRGVITNASTSDTTINYYIQSLTKNSDDIIKYIIKITTEPQINESRINREKKAVYEELSRDMNDENWKIPRKICDFFFDLEGLIYGGDVKQQINNLKHLHKKNIVEYCQRIYTPKNILFVVSGSFSREKVMKLFRENLPKNRPMGQKNLQTNLLKKNIRSEIFHIPDKHNKNAEVVFAFHSKIYPSDPKTCYFGLIKTILTGSMQSIFMRRLRSELHIIYNIRVYVDCDLYGTLTTIETTVKTEKVPLLIKEVKKILRNINSHFTTAQLRRAKDTFLINHDRICFNPVFLGNYYGDQFLSQIYKKNPTIIKHEDFPKIVIKATKKDIIHTCKKLFPLKKCLVIYQSPRKISKTRKKNR